MEGSGPNLVVCTNTCKEAAAQSLLDRSEELAELTEGYHARNDYIERGLEWRRYSNETRTTMQQTIRKLADESDQCAGRYAVAALRANAEAELHERRWQKRWKNAQISDPLWAFKDSDLDRDGCAMHACSRPPRWLCLACLLTNQFKPPSPTAYCHGKRYSV